MPTALTFNGDITKGVTLEGSELEPYQLQFHDRKFWGVTGVSRIFGGRASRGLLWRVLIYDVANADFNTARKLADYIAVTLNQTRIGTNGLLTVVSESDYAPFEDCTFQGAQIVDGIKRDTALTLGGGYWAEVMMGFTQLS